MPLPRLTGMTSPERSGFIVLVADDDALIRSVLRMALSSRGHEVVEARDSTEAISVGATREFDLVVLDINMPGGTVHSTVESLRTSEPRLPILLLSGELAPPDGLASEGIDFARKPVELDDFLDRVERLLRRALDEPNAS